MMKDWESLSLENCIDKVTYTKKVKRKDFLVNGKYKIISQEEEFINGYWNKVTDLFKLKKPVVIFGDHTKIIKYIDFDFVLGADGVKILQPNDKIFTKYLYYFLKSVKLKDLGYARHYRLLKEITVPFPPLPEQKRIVKILDEVFTAIEKAKENAEKNLENSRELFDSYLQGVFEKPGKDWVKKKLVDITTKIGSGATPRGGNKSYKTKGISLIRSLNVHNREFKENGLVFIDKRQAEKLSNVIVFEGDVLLNITGASVARCCVVPNEYLPARVNQHVSIIRLKNDILLPKFLNYLLTSKVYKNKLLKTGEEGGATRQALTKVQIQEFHIVFPKSFSEQEEVVNKIDEFAYETMNIEIIYKKKISDLEELKKSILQKAFSGELKTENKQSLKDVIIIENMNTKKPNPDRVK